MKIGIIGAGFTGLSGAYNLSEKGHRVVVFEKDINPGGLALGFKEKKWDWTLEKHYHHWFTNDKAVLSLAKKINHKVIIKRPKTSVLVDNNIYQFDSPKEVLQFPKLSIIDRLRMGFVIGVIKLNPFWKPLEKLNATKFLPFALGKKNYEMIWEPLFKNKFGPFASNISMSWFWARIVKRTPSLAYPEGGYLNFANHLVENIKEKDSEIKYNTEVIEIKKLKNNKVGVTVKEKNKLKKYEFDKVIFTLPTLLFASIAKGLPKKYLQNLNKLNSLGATNLVLRLKKPFLKDNTYWVSVCDKKSPIMAIVEHTNFMDRKYYDNEHLLYLGNYLPGNSTRFEMNKKEVLALFDPFLKNINPDYKKSIIGYELFKTPYAQPIIPTNYSKILPNMDTPLNNVYIANIDQVYPWDRGTNYAVELGEKIVNHILSED